MTEIPDHLRVVIRADASIKMGSGHVMRCLTLADALRERGATVHFICRELPGHLGGVLADKGYPVHWLPAPDADDAAIPAHTAHSAWLGVPWAVDAEQTQAILTAFPAVDWLIVDHYALDRAWESRMRPLVKRIMVIDDLADRPHDCDILLDQNLIAGMENRYHGRIPDCCSCLLGPQYALLRSEFRVLRSTSLARRKPPELKRLLIFMGGSDPTNEIGKVIAGVKQSTRRWEQIDVVVGQGFPELGVLKESLVALPSATLHIQTPDMARLMAAADLAVTAGGSVTWEKCALGLPNLVAILGENQRPIATAMHALGAQRTLGNAADLTPDRYAKHLDELQVTDLPAMIDRASSVCDGTGVEKVLPIFGNMK